MRARSVVNCVFAMTVLAGSRTFSDDERGSDTTAEQARLQHEQYVLQEVEHLRGILVSLLNEHRSQLETIREAAASAGDQDEVRRVNELLAEDSRVVRLEVRRSLWRSRSGFFERLHEGHWVEKVPGS